jgi:hypothetical protein
LIIIKPRAGGHGTILVQRSVTVLSTAGSHGDRNDKFSLCPSLNVTTSNQKQFKACELEPGSKDIWTDPGIYHRTSWISQNHVNAL